MQGSEDEEDLQDEEAEALRLQRETAAGLLPQDFDQASEEESEEEEEEPTMGQRAEKIEVMVRKWCWVGGAQQLYNASPL